jgi:hypothetical protein
MRRLPHLKRNGGGAPAPRVVADGEANASALVLEGLTTTAVRRR